MNSEIKNKSDGENRPAGDFLSTVATEIQDWLHDNSLNKTDTGKQWRLFALLSNGSQISIDQVSAHGAATIKIKGEFSDGSPALVITHLNSVQLVATYIPRVVPSPNPPDKCEIGFHTGFKDIRIPR